MNETHTWPDHRENILLEDDIHSIQSILSSTTIAFGIVSRDNFSLLFDLNAVFFLSEKFLSDPI